MLPKPVARGDESSTLPLYGVVVIPFLLFALRPRYWKRYRNVGYVTPDVIASRRKLCGRCVAVRDNDNFRLVHRPAWFRWLRIPLPSDLKDQTLHVRIAGVDAPEGKHFGMPMQPGWEESKAWMEKRILGRTLFIRPLRRDQYDRLVCTVEYRSWLPPFRKNLSLEMLKAGWATVYTAKGAEYDGMLERFQKAEADAKAAKRGMWASTASYVSPADHKKAYKK
ncbi:putative endonuclease lcl3 [Geranomyces variabilis]|nr:putative endonuclease lcl3 [Geranomyces variabilis]